MLEPGALVQEAVQIEQPLGECVGIVRVGIDDFVPIHGHFRLGGSSSGNEYREKQAKRMRHPPIVSEDARMFVAIRAPSRLFVRTGPENVMQPGGYCRVASALSRTPPSAK